VALDVVLHRPNERIQGLSQKERVLVTKLVQNITKLCKMSKKEVVEVIKTAPKYQPVLGDLFLEQTLNDWRLITNDPEPCHPAVPLCLPHQEVECVGVEYRI
jgi:hypothetical protein